MRKERTYRNTIDNAKEIFSNIFLVANPLVWYYTVNVTLQYALTRTPIDPSTSMLVWAIHYFAIILSATTGALFAKKVERKLFLTAWMIIGAFSSLFILLIVNPNIASLSLIALTLGISLGIGMPTCMGYFTSNVPIEKRGKTSGAVIFAFMFGMLIMTFLPYDPLLIGLVLSAWRLLSLFVFLKMPTAVSQNQQKPQLSYKTIFQQKSFILYFIPFLMFALVNYLPTQIQSNLGGELATNLALVQNVLLGIFAVIGGFLLDTMGRKRVAVIGFVMIGLSAAVIGIFPQNSLSWYLNTIFGGVAWGFVYVVFVLTIWGDLSDTLGNGRSDKFYALGVMPFFVSQFLEVALGSSIAESVSNGAIFSFATLFLFVAVLPLFYAPETLPEKTMKDRELKGYLEKAQKMAEKEALKAQIKDKNDERLQKSSENSDVTGEGEVQEYDEARRLAEQYY
jgi:MFS family permease